MSLRSLIAPLAERAAETSTLAKGGERAASDAPTVGVTVDSVRSFTQSYLLPLGTKIVVATLVFFVGRWLARLFVRGLARVMERSRVDVSLAKFLSDVLYAVLLVAVVTAALDTVGIRTTAVVAVLGAAGLAIGLALQGSLSNFAAGVMLIVLRPYRVGDQVVIGKYLGRVDAIKVFHTFLVCDDNREVIIPNGQIIAAPIENMTTRGTRRVDIAVSIANSADVRQVRELLEAVLLSDRRVLPAPAPAVELVEVSDAGTKLILRPWANVGDFRDLVTDLIERVRDTLEAQQLKFTIQPAAS